MFEFAFCFIYLVFVSALKVRVPVLNFLVTLHIMFIELTYIMFIQFMYVWVCLSSCLPGPCFQEAHQIENVSNHQHMTTRMRSTRKQIVGSGGPRTSSWQRIFQ